MREIERIKRGFKSGGEAFGGIRSVAVRNGKVEEGALGIMKANHETKKD